jgi:predicted DNA-binding transcriptional regulator AlpA
MEDHIVRVKAQYAEIEVRQGRPSPVHWLFPGPKRGSAIDFASAFDFARDQAQLEDFRFQDLRHCAASYLAMNGATLLEIAAVVGHKTLQMVKRYSHLSENHTSSIVSKMNVRLDTILKIFPVGRSMWWAGVKSGRYPPSVKLGPKVTAWKVQDIRALMNDLEASSRAEKPPITA